VRATLISSAVIDYKVVVREKLGVLGHGMGNQGYQAMIEIKKHL
jgi:hypothetical protein